MKGLNKGCLNIFFYLRYACFYSLLISYLNFKDQDEPDLVNDQDDENQSAEMMTMMMQHNKLTYAQNRPNIDLNQMPILKCLFDEISQLKSMLQGNDMTRGQILSKQSNKSSIKQPNKPGQSVLKKSKSSTMKVRTLSKPQQERRQHIRDTVERLSQPKVVRVKSAERNDETMRASLMTPRKEETSLNRSRDNRPIIPPIPKPRQNSPNKQPKQPLSYRTTNTHRLRVLASRTKRAENSATESAIVRTSTVEGSVIQPPNVKDQPLLEEIAKNFDELSVSGASNNDQKLKEFLERALQFDSTGSMISGGGGGGTGNLSIYNGDAQWSPAQTGVLKNVTQASPLPPLPPQSINLGVQQQQTNFNLTGTGNQSVGNLSLLNKVELDSTMDTMNYQQNLQNLLNTTTNLPSPTKTVQFGNVYQREYSSDDERRSHSESSTETNSSTSTSLQKYIEFYSEIF